MRRGLTGWFARRSRPATVPSGCLDRGQPGDLVLSLERRRRRQDLRITVPLQSPGRRLLAISPNDRLRSLEAWFAASSGRYQPGFRRSLWTSNVPATETLLGSFDGHTTLHWRCFLPFPAADGHFYAGLTPASIRCTPESPCSSSSRCVLQSHRFYHRAIERLTEEAT
jgi:hypothetical protein